MPNKLRENTQKIGELVAEARKKLEEAKDQLPLPEQLNPDQRAQGRELSNLIERLRGVSASVASALEAFDAYEASLGRMAR
jgi:Sec-independent protein translocase protein TatA